MTNTKPISDAVRKLAQTICDDLLPDYGKEAWEESVDQIEGKIQTAFDSEVANAVPPGFVVVPLVLTERMIEEFERYGFRGKKAIQYGYEAMIAASPPLPQPPAGRFLKKER